MIESGTVMGDLKSWHGLKPQYYRVKEELRPGLSVDYDETPASGELIFRFAGKEKRHPIEVSELLLGRYAVEIIQDSFLARLNQFTIAVTPNPCADEDFSALKSISSGSPNYCTPWMPKEDVGLRIAAPARVEAGAGTKVVVAMLCQIKHTPELPTLPESPTLIFINKDTGGVLRRTVLEIDAERIAKQGKRPGKGKTKPRQELDKGTSSEFFNVDVGFLLKPGTYGVVAVLGVFESNPLTITVGAEGETSVPEPMLIPITGDAGNNKLHAGPFQMVLRHELQGDLVKFTIGTKPKAKVDLLDRTSLGPTPVRFHFGHRVTFRLTDRSRKLRQVVTVVVEDEDGTGDAAA